MNKMATGKNSLQKLTNRKIEELLKKPYLKATDVETFTKNEMDELVSAVCEKVKGFQGDRKRTLQFMEGVHEAMPQYIRNQTWENNHKTIILEISRFIFDNDQMPDINAIHTATGLSRQTIHKHMKEYSSHPLFVDERNRFKLISSRLLAKLFKMASNGDVKAMRLYFEVVGNLGEKKSKKTKKVLTQNNYIQINQTVLTQDNISQLSADQLNEIEAFIREYISTASLITQSPVKSC